MGKNSTPREEKTVLQRLFSGWMVSPKEIAIKLSKATTLDEVDNIMKGHAFTLTRIQNVSFSGLRVNNFSEEEVKRFEDLFARLSKIQHVRFSPLTPPNSLPDVLYVNKYTYIFGWKSGHWEISRKPMLRRCVGINHHYSRVEDIPTKKEMSSEDRQKHKEQMREKQQKNGQVTAPAGIYG